MTTLKAIAESLLLPPMLFLVLALAGLVLARRHRLGSWVFRGGMTLFVLLGVPAVPWSMIAWLERDLPMTPPAGAPPAAIVVLAGDISRTLNPPFAQPGLLSLERIRAGAALHRLTNLPVLITGGTIQPDRATVAVLMANSMANDFQVPVRWIETQSRDTWENAEMSAAILRQNGIASVYVVTHAWHMRRALIAFRKAGLIATAAPTSLDTPSTGLLTDFVPRTAAWQTSYFAMHEWIGCAVYALR